ncbi:hypothetical protein BDV96DRAFT_652459 [Lophiotrema nucula]|uniref:Uncharacterized protein n=1 Tax=Lophiotrema nucula TaxID=690887 RepID=A0A6A5YRY6_9PLEO|nr:hypothetical protein BDV96DRAFT_652459 [Lophiotrema nucula]
MGQSPDRDDYAIWNPSSTGFEHIWDGLNERQQAYRKVDAANSLEELVLFMCLHKDGKAMCRYKAWNLLPVLESERGTIEFRRPCGSENEAAARHWAAFTLCLISSFHRRDWGDVTGNAILEPPRDLKSARAEIRKEARILGLESDIDFRFL